MSEFCKESMLNIEFDMVTKEELLEVQQLQDLQWPNSTRDPVLASLRASER